MEPFLSDAANEQFEINKTIEYEKSKEFVACPSKKQIAQRKYIRDLSWFHDLILLRKIPSTAKYTEKGDVPSKGCICLPAHWGEPYEIWYKNIVLNQLEP